MSSTLIYRIKSKLLIAEATARGQPVLPRPRGGCARRRLQDPRWLPSNCCSKLRTSDMFLSLCTYFCVVPFYLTVWLYLLLCCAFLCDVLLYFLLCCAFLSDCLIVLTFVLCLSFWRVFPRNWDITYFPQTLEHTGHDLLSTNTLFPENETYLTFHSHSGGVVSPFARSVASHVRGLADHVRAFYQNWFEFADVTIVMIIRFRLMRLHLGVSRILS
jgi:hypothetical protein